MKFNNKFKNAELEKICNCGFSLCPNQFGYITRPEKIKEVFGVDF